MNHPLLKWLICGSDFFQQFKRNWQQWQFNRQLKNANMDTPFQISTINQLHQLAKVDSPDHPWMTIFKIEDIPALSSDYPTTFTYDFYSIGFKKNLNGYVRYGRQNYDFQEGVLGFSAPNQAMTVPRDILEGANGWMVFFHADLLRGHSLAEKIQNYGFFNYGVHESLHLSAAEEQMLESLFQNIHLEYHLTGDQFSKKLLVNHLELLLNYADRYYRRQFVTRYQAENGFVSRFERVIKNYFYTQPLPLNELPSVSYFAEKLNVSPNYLSDTLRVLTGKSTQEHIHFHVLEIAKNTLLGTNKTISEVAYDLGFDYPQYFSRLFKEKTGFSPKQFRTR